MDPINYQAAMPQFDFLKTIQGGLQTGSALRERDLQSQQREAALQQAQQYQQDIQAAMAAPTPQAFAALALKYPERRDAVKQGWDQMSEGDRKQEGDTMAQAYSALLSDNKDVAQSVIQQQIDARKNSGLDTSHYDNALELVKSDPQKAVGSLGFILSHVNDPKAFATAYGALGSAQRATEQAPADLRDKNAKADGAVADVAQKNLDIVGQEAGALAKVPNLKPTQVAAFLQSKAAQGRIPKADLPDLLAGVPTDPKALPDYLNSIMTAGIKPADQQKYLAPTADAKLSADTSVKTTGMNNSTQLAVQDRIDARAKADAAGSDDSALLTPGAIDNAAARYNVDGTLPPMGMGQAAAAGRTKVLNRAAEMKLGVSPEQQRLDQIYNKGDAAARNAAVKDYSSGGKSGQAIQAANTSLNHLETVEQLALAQKNGNVRLYNQMANKLAAEFGGTAPTNLNAALSMVAPEVSKAVIGVAGTGEERAAFEKRFAGNGSPDQAIQGIGTIKELLGGRLTESQRTYERTTKKEDFDSMLSPAAKRVLDRAHQASHDGPAAGAVVDGYRFKGGDPAKKENWEKK